VAKRNRKRQDLPSDVPDDQFTSNHKVPKRVTITHYNRTQKEYSRLIETRDITFAIGSAGTGKTFLAAMHAMQALLEGHIERIIVCRPAVEAGGERIGFLPGGLNEKMDPYIRPIYDAMHMFVPQSRIQTMLAYNTIEIVPLAFMRGRTFKNAFIIADEMQNATTDQLLMLLTRLGEGSKMVITGDPMQSDVRGVPCFDYARRRLSNVPAIGFIEFTDAEVVRHHTVARILYAWKGVDEVVHDDSLGQLPAFILRKSYMPEADAAE